MHFRKPRRSIPSWLGSSKLRSIRSLLSLITCSPCVDSYPDNRLERFLFPSCLSLPPDGSVLASRDHNQLTTAHPEPLTPLTNPPRCAVKEMAMTARISIKKKRRGRGVLCFRTR